MPLVGDGATWLTEGSSPHWSSDGREILFTRNDDIWKIPATGGTPERLLQTPESEHSPRWSPDGTKILFVRPVGTVEIAIAELGDMELLK